MFASTTAPLAETCDSATEGAALNWYCVQTRPKKEQLIGARIREMFGLEVYAPKIRERRSHHGVLHTVESPLFPRYVFCRCALKNHYRAVKHVPDVVDLVSFGGRPAVVADDMIDSLQLWAGTVFDPLQSQACLAAGDSVKITVGAMRGLDAIFKTEMNDRERVLVVLSILERDVHLTLNRWQIEPVR